MQCTRVGTCSWYLGKCAKLEAAYVGPVSMLSSAWLDGVAHMRRVVCPVAKPPRPPFRRVMPHHVISLMPVCAVPT